MSENKKAEPMCPEVVSDAIEKFSLSPTGERLIAVMVDPVARTMTITQICEMADVSRDSYYRLFRQESFVQAYLAACRTLCITAAMPTVQSVAHQAIAGDMRAAQMVLEMTGLHQPTRTVEHIHTHDAGPTLRELLDRRKALS